MKRRLVVCLDGTWNNPYVEKERDDGSKVFKPSNVLKVARAVVPVAADGVTQVTYYDLGVGASNTHPGASNKMLRWVDNKLGGAWGAGFEGNIEDAFRFLVQNFQAGDDIFVFGFSRGAGEARGLCRFLDWMGGIPRKRDAYYAPTFFRRYLEMRGEGSGKDLLAEINRDKEPGKQVPPFVETRVRFVGVWDTVLALGSRVRAKDGTSVHARSFHCGSSPPPVVERARQALAIDERRYDFRPEIWAEPAVADQSLEQRWFAGVHSNAGGGYVDDGLANLSLRWMLAEAAAADLELDPKFVGFYKGYAMDQLYESRGMMYKVREAPLKLFGGGKKGIRQLIAEKMGLDGQKAGLTLDDSAIDRLNADPGELDSKGKKAHPQLELYRPETLLEYLRTRPDLHPKLSPEVLALVT